MADESKREYKRNARGDVGYLKGGGLRFTWGQVEGKSVLDDLEEAAPEEIAAFETEEQRRADEETKQHEREVELLGLCGLKHEDFARFRSVFRDGDILHVETRENGMNMRSVGAIRNSTYLRSGRNEFDQTYEDYEFQISGSTP